MRRFVGYGQSGMVSLMSTIIISLLLVIIVLSMVTLVTRELRQATDADLSIRAYYAAEAGVEDALLKLQRSILNETAPSVYPDALETCNQSAVGDVEYTCQYISIDKNQLEDSLEIEEPYQLELTNISFDYLELSWNQKDRGDASDFASIAGAFPPGASWRYPALMELTAIWYPRNPSFTFNQIDHATKVISPGVAASSTVTDLTPAGPAEARCDPNAVGYSCRIRINGFNTGATNRHYVLRLRPRYSGTHFKLQFFTSGGAVVRVPDQNATIDVTARAGDVYRRVRVNVPINAGTAGGLDYVLFSDNTICKDFKVKDAPGQNRAVPVFCTEPF